MDSLVEYRRQERAERLPHDGRRLHFAKCALLHPLMIAGVTILHTYQGMKIKVRGKVPKTDRPIIFATTHIGFYDVEVFLQAIGKHAYILSSDEEMMYRTFDGWVFDANGVIYVIPEDREDRHVAFETAVDYLKQGRNLLWYPEGTWNLTPNRVILPLHYGMIEAAARTGAVIVPVAAEQHDKEKYPDFTVSIGEAFNVEQREMSREEKIERAEDLRSVMAALKMSLWDTACRADFAADYWDRLADRRIGEWNGIYNLDLIRRRTFNPTHAVSSEEAFAHLETIQITPQNAFLLRHEYR